MLEILYNVSCGSGTGKTSLIFEPMIARDIERKRFFTRNHNDI